MRARFSTRDKSARAAQGASSEESLKLGSPGRIGKTISLGAIFAQLQQQVYASHAILRESNSQAGQLRKAL